MKRYLKLCSMVLFGVHILENIWVDIYFFNIVPTGKLKRMDTFMIFSIVTFLHIYYIYYLYLLSQGVCIETKTEIKACLSHPCLNVLICENNMMSFVVSRGLGQQPGSVCLSDYYIVAGDDWVRMSLNFNLDLYLFRSWLLHAFTTTQDSYYMYM